MSFMPCKWLNCETTKSITTHAMFNGISVTVLHITVPLIDTLFKSTIDFLYTKQGQTILSLSSAWPHKWGSDSEHVNMFNSVPHTLLSDWWIPWSSEFLFSSKPELLGKSSSVDTFDDMCYYVSYVQLWILSDRGRESAEDMPKQAAALLTKLMV